MMFKSGWIDLLLWVWIIIKSENEGHDEQSGRASSCHCQRLLHGLLAEHALIKPNYLGMSL
ncbi:COP9 signalosome complex subunit 6a-like [Gossypium australe]|uniref:COP9 signalosome complex subunit 6a-like n=1 Tax=Gossypium australe TaxID=47621 RepID=A0A5B6VR57_9ROSI|nr:COP9 signalosome complex subunit 6a-like [Gossypium australe]